MIRYVPHICQWGCNNVPKKGLKSVPPLERKMVVPPNKGGITYDFSGGIHGPNSVIQAGTQH